ncbi:MAG: CopG family ribbon-helix-helix protein [Acidobacteriota bacterium]
MAVTSIRLQSDLEQPLIRIASKLKRSKNWVLNQALREYLARCQLEEKRWQETLVALESVKEGRVVEGEAVEAWLQSWGKENELSPPKS